MKRSLAEMRAALLQGMLTGEINTSVLNYRNLSHHFGEQRWRDITKYIHVRGPNDSRTLCLFVMEEFNKLYPEG